MIGSILPERARFAEAFDDDAAAALFPAEEAVIGKAVPKRRNEFATARRCAREALAELGFPPAPILPGERGAPGWPDGVVGSMTHCEGYRAAVVAHDRDLDSLGIDAEPDEPLPEGVLDAIARPEEHDHLRRLDANGAHWDRLLFCAKESVYKTWFPLTRKWLDFEEASIEFHPGTATFRARILPATGPEEFTGRWISGNGLIITVITYTRR